MDRISELPEHILHHHILSRLSQKDAVRTCILSKSWRHLGPTRPKLVFLQSLLRVGTNKFLSVVENTLQRYVDQKLPIQEFIMETSPRVTWWRDPNFKSISLSLNEWIPKVVMNMGVKKFELRAAHYPLPSVVFQAEFLEELSLHGGCRIDNSINVKLQMLKRLVLFEVNIKDEAFEKIMSSCPLIECLQVRLCFELSTIKVNKSRNLKHFVCGDCFSLDSIEFNDDVPSQLETILITRCENWYKTNYFFPRLKSLCLHLVHLPTEFLNNLNCPCLEILELSKCSGFTDFKLSNRSIRSLILSTSESHPIKVISIDAANMIYFEFTFSGFVPSIVSFATTTSSSECMSRIQMWRSSDSKADDFSSTWSLELYEFLKALSQKSQISLDISYLPLTNQDTDDGDSSYEPVVVENLCLSAKYSYSALQDLFHRLFRICRPRYVGPTFSDKKIERQLREPIWKALVRKGKKREYKNWKRDLEKKSIQVLDEKTKEWRPGQERELFSNQSIRFWLEWKKNNKH